MDQPTKNQHFVPQFYLRNFLNDRNEVEVLDCEQRRLGRPRGTRGICYEEYFYGLRTGQPDDVSQGVEKTFQEMENELARAIGPVITKLRGRNEISEEEKWLVALLMSMIWIRGPAMRKQINAMAESVTKQVTKFRFVHPNADEIFDRYEKETGKTVPAERRQRVKAMMLSGNYSLDFNNVEHLRMLGDAHRYANLFWGQDWIVYVSECSRKFITSDNPVAVVIPERKGFYGPTFLERTHYFALAPDLFIEARYPKKDDGKKLKRKTLFERHAAAVLEANVLLASKASQYAYATDRVSLEEVIAEVQRREGILQMRRSSVIANALRNVDRGRGPM